VNLTAIRIKCAELVGWKNEKEGGFHLWSHPSGLPRMGSRIPNYPESADAALQLVEWTSKPENGEWFVEINSDTSMTEHDQTWEVVFMQIGNEEKHYGSSNSFALAVCLAFLKANSIEPETL
jgi:hypothetical protein